MRDDRHLHVERLIAIHKHTMLYGMVAFVLVVVLLSLFQYRLMERRALESGEGRFRDRLAALNERIDSTTQHVAQTRNWIEARLAAVYAPPALTIAYVESGDYFNLDLPRDSHGNVLGRGSPLGRIGDEREEFGMAVELLTFLKAVFGEEESIILSYYISYRQRFLAIYPYVGAETIIESSPVKSFERAFEYMILPYAGLVEPQDNPERRPFWTAPYVDRAGHGMMVSYGIPVYDEGRFRGLIGADITLRFLREFVEPFQEPADGLLILSTNQGQVLARSTGSLADAEAVPALHEVLPQALRDTAGELLARERPAFELVDDYHVLSARLDQAPMTLIHVLPHDRLFVYLRPSLAIYVAIVVSLIVFLTGVFNFVRRKFIGPTLAAERRLIESNAALREKTGQLEVLANKLSKYLSPQVYQSIFSGEWDVRIGTSRKRLTILFSDIVEFTPRAETMSDQALADWLNHYLNEMADLVLRYGGTLDKFIGDAVLVFFGDPQTLGEKEDARQCLRMAMDMRERAEALGMKIRIGIHSGECMVGNFGSENRMDYTIIGAAVNLAARLEASSEPGRILISDSTYRWVAGAVRCEPRGRIRVKGIEREIMTYWVGD